MPRPVRDALAGLSLLASVCLVAGLAAGGLIVAPLLLALWSAGLLG